VNARVGTRQVGVLGSADGDGRVLVTRCAADSAVAGVKFLLLDASSRFAQVALGDAKSSLGDAKSSLGDVKSSLGDVKSSLGDAKSSLGDVKSSLGDAKSSLGDAETTSCRMQARSEAKSLHRELDVALARRPSVQS
jgi:hypothetical protein